MSSDPESNRRRETAERLFHDGRQAVKSGQREQGRQLLLRAVDHDRNHSEAWLWLSATTDDLHEQKKYLEWAIAADPTNAAAKRGLGVVLGKIKPRDMLAEGQSVTPTAPAEPQAAHVERTFTCPQCGGTQRYDPKAKALKCEHCGHSEPVEDKPVTGQEQVLDFALPTRQAHQWAVGERRFTCQQCSGTTVLPAGQTSGICPYCGSKALVKAPEEADMIEPQAVLPFKLTLDDVKQAVQTWAKRGLFSPDDLTSVGRGKRLKPVYLPCWSFSASLTARWRAQVAEQWGKSRRWVWQTGERVFFYETFVVPGTKALPADLLDGIQPYVLADLVEYQPAYLAGWSAGTYDISLADASLDARAGMIEDAKRELQTKAAPGRAVTDLEVTGSDFMGQTYQFILLPVWVGAYRYQGKTYRILVNGQTGKVAGDKPVDRVKVAMVAVGAGLVALVALAVTLLAVLNFLNR